MSFEARGVLCYLLTRPQDWTVRMKHLQKVTGYGRDKCQRAVTELVEHGYAKRETIQGDDGKFLGQELVIYDEMQPLSPQPDFQAHGDRLTDLPSDGFSGTLISTDSLISTDKHIVSKKIDTTLEVFEEVWKSFPKTGNPPKHLAKQRWKRLSQKDKDECVVGARAYANLHAEECKTWKDKGAIHLSTFISQRRWEDFEAPTETTEVWKKRLSYQKSESNWFPDEWGPAPGEQGCLVPQELLQVVR